MKLLTTLSTTILFTLGSLASAGPIGLSPEGQKASAPDIAVNSKGDIAVLWVDRSPQEKPGDGSQNHDRHLAVTDVYVSISKDGGTTFSAPTKVNASSGAVWGQQVSRPRIVGTPNDFGRAGERPTHPELLDYLANEFVASGFSIRHIHRLILRSKAYRQSSEPPADAALRELTVKRNP